MVNMENELSQSAPLVETKPSGLALTGESDERKVPAGGPTTWNLLLKVSEPGKRKVRLKTSIALVSGEAAEWTARIYDANGSKIWDSQLHAGPEIMITMDVSKPKDLKLELEAPKGVRFGESATVTLEACFDAYPTACERMTFSAVARQSVVALKTSIGHERNVADGVASKAKGSKTEIYAILAPTTLRGYVLIEGMNTDELRETVRGVRKAHGLVEGETSFAEVDHFLTPKAIVSGIMEGDVVELVAGPFKGEKARVKQIDEAKEEITVELFEAMVPIPVTVRGDHVRVLEKEK
jgi:transcriptional antiterminator NusG